MGSREITARVNDKSEIENRERDRTTCLEIALNLKKEPKAKDR